MYRWVPAKDKPKWGNRTTARNRNSRKMFLKLKNIHIGNYTLKKRYHVPKNINWEWSMPSNIWREGTGQEEKGEE